jgi:reactive intermediate/imine deaminase
MRKTIYPVAGPLADAGLYSGKVAFSRGVKVDDAGTLLFVSGALGVDAHRQIVGKGDMGAQTRQVLRNLGEVLKEAGATFQDVVKVTVFVSDITQFRAIHDARLDFFHPDHLPASTMVQVSGFVNPDALIEIECYAVLPARAKRSAAKKPLRRTASRPKGKAKGRKKR